MSLSVSDVFTPATAKEWMQRFLQDASTLGLKTTAWFVGGTVRAIIAAFSYSEQLSDAVVSGIAQGGFLDSAAKGVITITDPNGVVVNTPVTVEGGPGWLDVLADGIYNVQRDEQGFASGLLAITNTSATRYPAFAAGTYHVADPNTKQSYSNVLRIPAVPPSVEVGSGVSGVANSSGAVKITTTAAHGLVDDDIVTVKNVLGIAVLSKPTSWRVDALTSTTFLLRGSKFSGSYTGGGNVYVPTVIAAQADNPGSVADTLNANGVAAANTVTQPITNLVGVTVANVDPWYGTDQESNAALANRCRLKLQTASSNGPKGAYESVVLTGDDYAALLSPPRHLSTTITRETTATDPTTGTVYVFAANASGAPSDDDIATLNLVLQAWATPNAVTAFVIAPQRHELNVEVEVWLPAVSNTKATRALIQTAIQAAVEKFPIGGVSDPFGTYSHVLPMSYILDAIEDVGDNNNIPFQDVQVGFGGTVKLWEQLAYNPSAMIADVVVLSPAVPTVVLVSV